MDKIFVDTDIILDLLSERHPHYTASANLFSLADIGKVKLYISPLSFSNLHYILRKQYSSKISRQALQRLKTLVQVVPVNDKIIELALASDFPDFEDAIQYYTAVDSNLEIILTRNLKDYRKASITVMTAGDYLKSIGI